MIFARPRRAAYFAAVLAGGVLALALPSAVTLLADGDAPVAVKTVPATTTSKPAPLAPKSKEAKKAEEIARVMDFFKVTQPDAYDKAVKLRQTDPAKFESTIQPVIRTVNALEEIHKNDPDLYKLKIQDYQFTFQFKSKAEQLHRPDILPSERETVLGEMSAIAAQQFDVQQQIRQKEIAAIEVRVGRLQADFADREKNKEKIIKNRLAEYTKTAPAATMP